MSHILVCTFLLCVMSGSAHLHKTDMKNVWQTFKGAYSKKYDAKTEEKSLNNWIENTAYIQTHNLGYDLGAHTFSLGINEYSDWSPKEYNKYLNGLWYQPDKHPSTDLWEGIRSQYDVNSLPDTVDWRDKGYVTPVKNQGACGSCWAFGSTGTLEGQHFRKTGKLVSLSEQNLVDCVKKNGGCNGGVMYTTFEYVKNNGGLDTEACYPYQAKNLPCRYNSSCIGTTCSGEVGIPRGNEADLKIAVATQGPIVVGLDASHPSFQQYRQGVYVEPKCRNDSVDHAVLLVGYGVEDGMDYWLVKNSWGTSWGMKGYIKTARNHNNMCAIATYASYPIV